MTCLNKCAAGANAFLQHDPTIVPLSYRYIPVEGDTVAALKIAAEIGRMVAKMHDAQVTSPTLNHSRVCSRMYDVLRSA